MWFGRGRGSLDIRHDCDHSDPNIQYGWTRHDGTSFGQQDIKDLGTHLQYMKTSSICTVLVYIYIYTSVKIRIYILICVHGT